MSLQYLQVLQTFSSRAKETLQVQSQTTTSVVQRTRQPVRVLLFYIQSMGYSRCSHVSRHEHLRRALQHTAATPLDALMLAVH